MRLLPAFLLLPLAVIAADDPVGAQLYRKHCAACHEAGSDSRIPPLSALRQKTAGKVVWDFDAVRDFSTVNGVAAKGGAFDAAGVVIAGGMLFVGSGYGNGAVSPVTYCWPFQWTGSKGTAMNRRRLIGGIGVAIISLESGD